MSADAETMNEVNWSDSKMTIVGASKAAQAFIDKMNAITEALAAQAPLAAENASVAQTGQLAAQSVGGSAEATERTV